MPLYAYKCESCEYSFKQFHGIDEKPGKCVKCSNDSLKKQFLPNQNITSNKLDDSPKKRIEKFIEESRVALEEQKAEARKEIKQ